MNPFRRLARSLGMRIATLVLLLGAALIATGCLIYDEHIAYDAGGGGLFALTCGIDLSALGSLGFDRDAAPEDSTPAAHALASALDFLVTRV